MPDDRNAEEERLLRSVALQNAKAILAARQKAERALLEANQALERKAGELARAVAMLRATLESTTDGILVIDSSGTVTDCNDTFVAMWGVPRPLLNGGTHAAVVERMAAHFAAPALFQQRVGRIDDTSPPESFDVLELADGRVFERFSRPQLIGGGTAGRVWSFRDITGQRLAQQQLRNESERFRITLASIGDAVICTDPQGVVTFVNAVAEKLTGWRYAEAVGRPLPEVFDIVDQSTRAALPDPAIRALRDGPIVGLADHTLLIARDGVERPIDDSAAPIRDASGTVVGAVLVFRDVTERLQGYEAQARLAAIVESSQDAIISKSLDGTIQSWNSEAERLLGYTADEAIGQHITLIIPEDRVDEERAIMQRLRRGERVKHFETSRLTKHGRLIDLSVAISPIRNARGQVVGASKVARDISDRRAVEEARRVADRRKDEFLAVLAHELRNPLAPLVNGLQVMRLAADQPAAVGRVRTMMERQLSHLVRLVDDLLDVSRITRNQMDLRRSRLLLADVVNSALETARPLLEAASHTIAVCLPPEPIHIDGDLTRLSQVFSNLLTNSAKYTDPGGHITLHAACRDGHVLDVSISDTGIGIPAEHLRTVFDMFSQVEPHVSRSQSGLGIGLALVDGLVRMHGGTVTADSPGPGRGSTFTVSLPLVTGGEACADPPSARPAAATRPQRMLVVDDNVDAATSTAMMLEYLGHQVRTAHDGIDALEQFHSYRPEVVLMDLGMPHLDGYEAVRRIRAQPSGQGVIIVALTGWGHDDDKARSRAAGCDGHLTKPVDLSVLQVLVERLLAPGR